MLPELACFRRAFEIGVRARQWLELRARLIRTADCVQGHRKVIPNLVAGRAADARLTQIAQSRTRLTLLHEDPTQGIEHRRIVGRKRMCSLCISHRFGVALPEQYVGEVVEYARLRACLTVYLLVPPTCRG